MGFRPLEIVSGWFMGTYVVELDRSYGTMGLDRFGQRHDGLHMERGHGILPEVQAMLMPPGTVMVDEGLRQRHQRKATPGLGLVYIDPLGGGVAVVHDPVGGDGGTEHTVLEGNAFDGHGFKHMGIFCASHKKLPFQIIFRVGSFTIPRFSQIVKRAQ